MAPQLPKFKHSIRARWSECDPQGLVFNAIYLNYFEIVQAEYFRSLGISMYDPKTWETFAWVVRKAELEFFAPVVVDEAVDLHMAVTSLGRSSLTVMMIVQKSEASEIAFSANLVLVNFDNDTHASRPLPDWVRSKVTAFEGLEGS